MRWIAMDIRRAHYLTPLLLATAIVFLSGKLTATASLAYRCHSDICNRDVNIPQYCSEKEKRCRKCDDIRDSCRDPEMPRNCSEFCLNYELRKIKDSGECSESDIPKIDHGKLNSDNLPTNHKFPQGYNVSYTCNEGYRLSGQHISVCGLYGQWSLPPICEAIVCTLTMVEGLHVSPSKPQYDVGSQVEVTCPDDMNGKRALTCLSTGNWDNTMPLCKKNGSIWKILSVVFIASTGICILVIIALVVVTCSRSKYNNCLSRKHSVNDIESRTVDQRLLPNDHDTAQNYEPKVFVDVKEDITPKTLERNSVHSDTVVYEGGKMKTAKLMADAIPPRSVIQTNGVRPISDSSTNISESQDADHDSDSFSDDTRLRPLYLRAGSSSDNSDERRGELSTGAMILNTEPSSIPSTSKPTNNEQCDRHYIPPQEAPAPEPNVTDADHTDHRTENSAQTGNIMINKDAQNVKKAKDVIIGNEIHTVNIHHHNYGASTNQSPKKECVNISHYPVQEERGDQYN